MTVKIKKIKRKLRSFYRYRKTISSGNAYLCIFDEIFHREMVRPIIINGFHFYIRTNTTDLNVAIKSLYVKEYDHILLYKPKVIIDGGAYIGTSSIFFAFKYPSARIFAIEPEDSNFELLQKNVKTYENILPIKAAIWGTTMKRTIKNRLSGQWGYTVSESSNRIEATDQEINCITIDTLMEDYGIESIDLLKLDIEGSEKEVFENSKCWIDSVGTITVELHDRICMGCTRAFYLATRDFMSFETHGEKITAYRHSMLSGAPHCSQ